MSNRRCADGIRPRRGLERLCHSGPRRPGADRCGGMECAARRAGRRPRRSCATSTCRAARVGQRRSPRTGWQPQFLAVQRGDALRRRLPALPEDALLRRVRVRLGLGRRLPAPRPALLPEAARRRAVHAGAGRAAAGARRMPARRVLLRAMQQLARSDEAVVGAPAVPRRRRPRGRDAPRLDDAQHGAVPLDATRPTRPTPTSPTSSPACSARSARRSSRSAAASPRPASSFDGPRGRRDHDGRLGLLLPLLHAHLPRAPLDALPDARLLRPHGRDDGRALADVRRAARRRAHRRLADRHRSATARVAFGRYWGCTEHVPCLHFEACYYQPLAWCIAQGYQRFEGGAQGEHKMARGLLPVQTRSAHWLAHPQFAQAVADFLAREGAGVENYLDELNERQPVQGCLKSPASTTTRSSGLRYLRSAALTCASVSWPSAASIAPRRRSVRPRSRLFASVARDAAVLRARQPAEVQQAALALGQFLRA